MDLKCIEDYRSYYKNNSVYSCMEICLKRAEKLDSKYHVFISLDKEKILKRAEELDRSDFKGRLFGIPVAIKDNIAVKGEPLTCGSEILKDYISPYSAGVVEKLEKEGAVIFGKTNLDEFAMGSSTENSSFFPTLNPLDVSRVPGGSSGGSAAAVCAGIVPVSLGSDTGGSIRQPASFNGIYGLKPTYGAVSRYGLTAFASSLDVIGPLAGTLADAELVFDVIRGRDSHDSTSLSFSDKNCDDTSCVIGVPEDSMLKGTDPGIRNAYKDFLNKLNDNGYELKEFSSSLWDYALKAYYIIASSEASSNLARFDGVRYGYRGNSSDINDIYVSSRTSGFGREVKRRIILGTYCLSSGYYDHYYQKADDVRTSLKKEFADFFKNRGFILTPCTPDYPFLLKSKQNPVDMYRSDRLTVAASLAGLPALSVPLAENSEKLCSGLQIIGDFGDEKGIFDLTKKFQSILYNF